MACVGCFSPPDPVAGILLLGASVGPIGLRGTLSPSASKSAILVDPGGMFPSSDLAVTWDPAIPAESAGLRGPVGPTMTLGMLPLSDEIGEESITIHGG